MADIKIISLEELLLKRLPQYNHSEFHVHHTWRPNFEIYASKPDPLYWQEAMRDYHMGTHGWRDIAQHITLSPDGTIVTGRDFGMNPSSITGKNSKAFMMEMIGDFDVNRDPFEGKQKETALAIARYFDKKGKYIRFHNENSSKTCPGNSISKANFMAEVRGYPTIVTAVPNTVKLRDTGDTVRLLQEKLTAAGFKPGYADGVFGARTYQAAVDYQYKNKLTPDGIVGRQTWSKLLGIVK